MSLRRERFNAALGVDHSSDRYSASTGGRQIGGDILHIAKRTLRGRPRSRDDLCVFCMDSSFHRAISARPL
jgi:hypothetical protein